MSSLDECQTFLNNSSFCLKFKSHNFFYIKIIIKNYDLDSKL